MFHLWISWSWQESDVWKQNSQNWKFKHTDPSASVSYLRRRLVSHPHSHRSQFQGYQPHPEKWQRYIYIKDRWTDDYVKLVLDEKRKKEANVKWQKKAMRRACRSVKHTVTKQYFSEIPKTPILKLFRTQQTTDFRLWTRHSILHSESHSNPTLQVPKWSTDSKPYPVNLLSLQRSKSPNLALGKELRWKTVGNMWRNPTDGKIHGGSPCLDV